MKALTVIQPWATVLALGLKRYETRGWATPYRGPLLIHAGRNDSCLALAEQEPWRTVLRRAGYRRPSDLPLGALLGVSYLSGCRQTDDLAREVSAQERAFGFWDNGRWAWRLPPLYQFGPIKARGMMGLWDRNPGVVPLWTFPGPRRRPVVAS